MISIIDYACSACLFFIMIIFHRGLYLALHCRGHFNSFFVFFMITAKVRMKPRQPDSLFSSSNQGRENDSVSIKHGTGSYSEYIYI